MPSLKLSKAKAIIAAAKATTDPETAKKLLEPILDSKNNPEKHQLKLATELQQKLATQIAEKQKATQTAKGESKTESKELSLAALMGGAGSPVHQQPKSTVDATEETTLVRTELENDDDDFELVSKPGPLLKP